MKTVSPEPNSRIPGIAVVSSAIWFLLVFPATGGEAPKSHGGVFEHRAIEPGFQAGKWSVLVGWQGEMGAPSWAFLKLFARKGARVVPLGNPQDLVRLDGIKIGSTQEAMALVLLFTAPETFFLCERPWYMALTMGKAGANAERAGRYGRVNGSVVKRLSLRPASVVHVNGVYRITRDLLEYRRVTEPLLGYPVVRVTEEVSGGGGYRRVSSKELGVVSYREVRVPVLRH